MDACMHSCIDDLKHNMPSLITASSGGIKISPYKQTHPRVENVSALLVKGVLFDM